MWTPWQSKIDSPTHPMQVSTKYPILPRPDFKFILTFFYSPFCVPAKVIMLRLFRSNNKSNYMLWVYMESIVQFSTIENPMNCKVFKVNLIEKLFEKLKLANSTIITILHVLWSGPSVRTKLSESGVLSWIRNNFKIHLTSILCQLGLLDDPIQLIHNS